MKFSNFGASQFVSTHGLPWFASFSLTSSFLNTNTPANHETLVLVSGRQRPLAMANGLCYFLNSDTTVSECKKLLKDAAETKHL